MTILLYDCVELEERASRHLRVWKGWHITLYILVAVFGILNYTFLQSTMQLVENNCVLYPREMQFHMIERPDAKVLNDTENVTRATTTTSATSVPVTDTKLEDSGSTISRTIAQNTDAVPSDIDTSNGTLSEKSATTKREAPSNNDTSDFETTITVNNVTVVLGNRTHRLALDVSRTFFGEENNCQFAEYTPILSSAFALVWLTLFIMCPDGGRTRSGLQQPWRILTPALVFALVMVCVMGYSFSITNGGLHAFCEAFHNVTNVTTCSPVNEFIESAWNSSVGVSGRVGGARAASAGAWAAWACAGALLLARCLAAPDFVVKKTGAYLTRDPQQKVTPYLKGSPRRSQRSSQSSPVKRDTASVRSEPTVTTELVTASVEPGPDSAPTSVLVTPVKNNRGEMLEMTYMQQELPEDQR